MTFLDYESHVLGRLCWACHEATRPSHLQQRRCPTCLRKWSYQGRRVEWELLKAFALDATAHRAAQVVGCSYPTAHRTFMACRLALGNLTLAERGPLLVKLGLKDRTASRSRSRSREDVNTINHAFFGIVEWNESVHVVTAGKSKEELLTALLDCGLPGMVLFADRLTSIKDLTQYSGDVLQGAIEDRRPMLRRIEAFWRSVSARIRWHARGVSPKHLAAYLTEGEYRFNHPLEALIEQLFLAVIQPYAPSCVA